MAENVGESLLEALPCTCHRLERVELPCGLPELAMGLGTEPCVFLLDSASDVGGLGRFSFLAVRPRFVLRVWRAGRRARVQVDYPGADRGPCEFDTSDPFEVVRGALRATRVGRSAGVRAGGEDHVPFIGGLVGYIGYEMLHFVEEVPEVSGGGAGLADLLLAGCDTVVALDHGTDRTYLSVIGRGADRESARAQADGLLEELSGLVDACASQVGLEDDWEPAGDSASPQWGSSLSQGAYLRTVGEILERIAAGDLYEMNLTRRVSRAFAGRAERLYARLRQTNPAPFGAYFRFPEASVLSCSPERFLRLSADRRVETRPIKGTRPRGTTRREDDRLARELSASVKDRAEHAMIVDLLRNDLGRVCEFHSVRVPEEMVIERYASVLQMVSTVAGRLRPGLDVVDLLRATFPGGSMTGAPKVAAMKLISRLEPVPRGVYSGCLGYMDARGGCDLSIVIRTLILRDGRVHVHAGGAIVADSDPQAEFEEACLKARALVRAADEVARRSGQAVRAS